MQKESYGNGLDKVIIQFDLLELVIGSFFPLFLFRLIVDVPFIQCIAFCFWLCIKEFSSWAWNQIIPVMSLREGGYWEHIFTTLIRLQRKIENYSSRLSTNYHLVCTFRTYVVWTTAWPHSMAITAERIGILWFSFHCQYHCPGSSIRCRGTIHRGIFI